MDDYEKFLLTTVLDRRRAAENLIIDAATLEAFKRSLVYAFSLAFEVLCTAQDAADRRKLLMCMQDMLRVGPENLENFHQTLERLLLLAKRKRPN